MATGKKERKGTSLCRESTSVGTLVGDEPKPSRQRRNTHMQDQVSRQYVGIDLHRRRSVIVRIDEAGKVLGKAQVLNDPVEFALAMAGAGEGPEVALEATYGYVRHEAPFDRVGCKGPPAACRSRPLKLGAA